MHLLIVAAIVSSAQFISPAINQQVQPFPQQEVGCRGCGCRGGPGWRIKRTGKCASHKNLRKKCGNPPSRKRCKKEN